MVVLGVDPGLRVAGYSVLSVHNRRHYVLTYGACIFSQRHTVSYRVGCFYDAMQCLVSSYGATVISIETPFLGKNAHNFLKLGYVRGMVYLLAYQHNIIVREFSPREVKQSVTGFGGASKDQVSRMVHWLCPQVHHVAYDDVTDALAVALCGGFAYM